MALSFTSRLQKRGQGRERTAPVTDSMKRFTEAPGVSLHSRSDDMRLPVLRSLWLVIGLGCWATAALVYQDEAQRLHNRLVDWWVSVKLAGDKAIASHLSWAALVVRQMLRVLNWAFPDWGLRSELGRSVFILSSAVVSINVTTVLVVVPSLNISTLHEMCQPWRLPVLVGAITILFAGTLAPKWYRPAILVSMLAMPGVLQWVYEDFQLWPAVVATRW